MSKTVGSYLKKLRKDLSLRKVESLTGINYAHLHQIENSKYTPKLDILVKLAPIYGFEVKTIIEDAEKSIKKSDKPNPFDRGKAYICASYDDLTEFNQKLFLEYLDFLFYKQRKDKQKGVLK